MKYIGTTTRDMRQVADLTWLTPDEHQFRAARFELLSRFNQTGHYGCMVYADEYEGNGRFRSHLYPVDAAGLAFEKRGPITLDALYDKTKLAPPDLPHITDGAVVDICWDKKRTHDLLGDLQAKSLVVEDVTDLPRLHELDNGSGLVVVKSFTGYGGEQVRIAPPKQLASAIKLPPFPLLAEEFIETSLGVPGLVEGRHDVRVIVINGEPIGGSVRTPAEGRFLSNTHQGGAMRMLGLPELPPDLLAIVAKVDAKLPQKPRLYAADFMYAKPQNRWFLIELNGSPGSLPSSFAPVGPIFQQKLYDALLAMASK